MSKEKLSNKRTTTREKITIALGAAWLAVYIFCPLDGKPSVASDIYSSVNKLTKSGDSQVEKPDLVPR